ncbi:MULTISPECIES: hypothetical protein [unclassified Providencia]|uniref:hypothetical protein n=1 Tax=unclassified Providencia TaxID=2633465 RepID=UPI0012B5CA66|nr:MULTISPECIES: hypothetical protein [unclassified Providencia]MTC21863.1 hypothetical protein [Providencia sp. wls1938]MTC23508.1 hypothetical protein [Providencia sp. wls1938]MTC24617.1 hypothetical protein [Providencia sp. wls1938]MTC24942.1 hypothetical protein [Providencia sp. wls1938]
MDKSRQQFEDTIKSLSDPSEFESKLKRANNGLNYADRDVDLMWISWQASRASLEFELPEGFGVHEVWCYTAVSVENELISNGVKIKNE